MSKEVLSFSQIAINDLNSAIEFRRKVVTQINKDFAQVGVEEIFETEIDFSYDELWLYVKRIVEYLFEHQLQTLFQFIYRVDLNEKTTKAAFELSENPMEELTRLIIEREAVKVYLKLKFSS